MFSLAKLAVADYWNKMDHNICLERGWVYCFTSHDGVTHYTCPCDQYRYPPVYIPSYVPTPIYGPMINPNYHFPIDGNIPDVLAPYNLCNSAPHTKDSNVGLCDINFQIESAGESSTQEECEIECDISPSRDELSSSSSSTCEITQCDVESESDNKKKRIRKRKPKRKIIKDNVKDQADDNVKDNPDVNEKYKTEDKELTKVDAKVDAKEVAKVDAKVDAKVEIVDKSTKKKKKKSKKKRSDDEILLEQLIKENEEAKREYELKCAIIDICQSSNKVLAILQLLLSKPDTRCYCENIAYQIKHFLGMEDERIVRLGPPVIKDRIAFGSLTTNINFVEIAIKSFDNFYTCSQLSDLANESALDISNAFLARCLQLCGTIYRHLVNLLDAKIDIHKIYSLIDVVNKEYNWKEEAIQFLGAKLTDVYQIFPTIEWPVMEKIHSFKDLYILKDCTWGTLSNKDRCGKCGATKGTIIYSSCCYTRQIFCKCDCNLVDSTVPCQNLSSKCIGDVMHIKDLLQSQSLNKHINVELRKTLLEQDKTIVPRIVGKFNSKDI